MKLKILDFVQEEYPGFSYSGSYELITKGFNFQIIHAGWCNTLEIHER
jgi:hypothetical protein